VAVERVTLEFGRTAAEGVAIAAAGFFFFLKRDLVEGIVATTSGAVGFPKISLYTMLVLLSKIVDDTHYLFHHSIKSSKQSSSYISYSKLR
jgi:hypothetical protein